MRGVASSAGLLAVEIFGYRATPAERMREFATLFGYAFQLTNIIRDVGADLELGRVYLPASDMKEAGYTRAALLLREHNAAFDRLMDALYRRAQTYYRAGPQPGGFPRPAGPAAGRGHGPHLRGAAGGHPQGRVPGPLPAPQPARLAQGGPGRQSLALLPRVLTGPESPII